MATIGFVLTSRLGYSPTSERLERMNMARERFAGAGLRFDNFKVFMPVIQ